MTLLVPWLVFPVVLGVLAAGAGLLLERLSSDIPHALTLPAGLALVIVVAQFTTMTSPTAQLTVPLVVGIAVAGFGLAFTSSEPGAVRLRRPDWAAVGVAVGTFTVYAAPVVLSGEATFTGYVKLDDTATFLGFTDRLMTHGRDLGGLAPSTYQAMLSLNIGHGYPVGAFLPLGIGARLTGQDPAWVFQPCMAFFAAMVGLALYAMLDGLVRARALRALAAFVAAQAALLYAYALWGGIKELAAAAMIALSAALVPVRREELRSARGLVPFATAAAATLGVLSVFGLLWIAPLALPAIVIVVRRRARPLRAAAAGLCAIAVLSIPSLAIGNAFIQSYKGLNFLDTSQRLGNLVRPLSLTQIFGIWPSGDFRFTPGPYALTKILIGICALAAAATVAYAFRRGSVRLPLIALTCVVAALVLDVASSPWLVAKALAESSPFLVVLALAGAAVLLESGRRVEGVVLAAFVVGGVLWSNVLGYHAAWLAPRGQLTELERIGDRFAGDGPALMTEYQPYGVRHFLRRLDAEGASELRVRQVPLADGTTLDKAQYADLDRFRYPDLLVYRTLVVRTSPFESRPAAPYRLVLHGRFYDVWQRPSSGGPQVLEHLPLGSSEAATARPRCREVRSAAARAAGEGAVLATAAGPRAVVVALGSAVHPAAWLPDSTGQTVEPTGAGVIRASVFLPHAGAYRIWVNGTFFRNLAVAVDGRRVGSVDTSGSLYADLASVPLTQGTHQVTLTYGSPTLAPGSGAPMFPIGPLVLALDGPPAAVSYVPPSRAGSLCGRRLDWIEVVRF